MPLALILPRRDQWYLLRKPLIRRDKGDTLSLLVQFLLKLRVPCAPPPASLLISTIFELAATGPTLPFLHLFLVPPKSPPFSPWRLQLFSGFLRFLASFSPSPTLPSFPFPSSPFPSSLLTLGPSPFPSGVRRWVSTSVPIPALSPLPSPFPSCAPSFTPTPVSTPAPSPSPWPFTSPFPSPTPLPSPFPPPTRISPPTPVAPSCASVTPPVRCACTDTGPCERNCRVLASATPCLQKWWRVRNESACCKTKENRRRRRATSVPSARCWDSLECIVCMYVCMYLLNCT